MQGFGQHEPLVWLNLHSYSLFMNSLDIVYTSSGEQLF